MSPSIRISAKSARVLLDALGPKSVSPPIDRALCELVDGLAPKPRSSAVRKTERKRRAKSVALKEIRAAVFARAAGRCECCGQVATPTNPLTVDHFFGRGKAKQSVANCWGLTVLHHREKTDNVPDALSWLRSFISHSRRHDYPQEIRMASALLQKHEAKAELAKGLS